MRHTEVDERIKKVSPRGGVPLDGCVLGLATLGVVKSQMHIAPCKAVLHQFLHHAQRLCTCHRVLPVSLPYDVSFMYVHQREVHVPPVPLRCVT